MHNSMGRSPRTIGQLPLDDAFPGRAMEFTHELYLDDRLTLASVADLADRLPRRSVIADTAAQPLLVPQGGPPRGALERPGDVIRDMRNANAWLTLLNLEDDPGMAELMDTQLSQLESAMIARQGTRKGRMRKRVAFVFVSSPNSVTPVHFDIEHSLLMQVSGKKTVSIGRWESERGPAARGQQVLGRLPRAYREPASGGRRVHPDARAGGVHTSGHAALGA